MHPAAVVQGPRNLSPPRRERMPLPARPAVCALGGAPCGAGDRSRERLAQSVKNNY